MIRTFIRLESPNGKPIWVRAEEVRGCRPYSPGAGWDIPGEFSMVEREGDSLIVRGSPDVIMEDVLDARDLWTSDAAGRS